MAEQRRFPAKAGLCLGYAALALCFGCSSSDAGSGPAGGAGASGAGGSNAGASGVSAGATSGGGGGGVSGSAVAGSSGATDRGGASDCGECFVANQCLDHCGGTVVYTGCCACVAPAIDKNTCPPP